MPGSYAPAFTPPGRAVDVPSDSVDSRVVVTGPSAPAGTAPRRIRVAFADDSYLIREAIALLLSREPRVAVVALCEDGDALRAAIDAEHPDVVFTDPMPPSGDAEGIVFAKWLRVTHPDIGVVVLSQYLDPAHSLALLEDGYDRRGYLLKERLKHGASWWRHSRSWPPAARSWIPPSPRR